ncbi:MAG: hypothetical protein ACRC6X_03110 [Culicoidibacterales bacterium]
MDEPQQLYHYLQRFFDFKQKESRVEQQLDDQGIIGRHAIVDELLFLQMDKEICLTSLIEKIDTSKIKHIVICGNKTRELACTACGVKQQELFVIESNKLVDNYYCQMDKIATGNKKTIKAIVKELNLVKNENILAKAGEKHCENELVNIIYEDDQAVSAIHGSIYSGKVGWLKHLLNMSECPLGGAKQLLHYFIQCSLRQKVNYICVVNSNVPAKILELMGFEYIIVLSLNDA